MPTDDRRAWINISSDALLLIFLFLCLLLFAGTPDLYDVVLYRLSDGKVALPTKVLKP